MSLTFDAESVHFIRHSRRRAHVRDFIHIHRLRRPLASIVYCGLFSQVLHDDPAAARVPTDASALIDGFRWISNEMGEGVLLHRVL